MSLISVLISSIAATYVYAAFIPWNCECTLAMSKATISELYIHLNGYFPVLHVLAGDFQSSPRMSLESVRTMFLHT